MTDNPTLKVLLGWCSDITKYYLGAMLAYLEIRISDTFGGPLGMSEDMSYKFNLQH